MLTYPSKSTKIASLQELINIITIPTYDRNSEYYIVIDIVILCVLETEKNSNIKNLSVNVVETPLSGH